MKEVLNLEGRWLFMVWCTPELESLVFLSPGRGAKRERIILVFRGVRFVRCRLRSLEPELSEPSAEEADEMLSRLGLQAAGARPWVLRRANEEFVLAESLTAYTDDFPNERILLDPSGEYVLASESRILFASNPVPDQH